MTTDGVDICSIISDDTYNFFMIQTSSANGEGVLVDFNGQFLSKII